MSEAQKRHNLYKIEEYTYDSLVLLTKDSHNIFAFWSLSPDYVENKVSALNISSELTQRALKVENLTYEEYFFIRINDFSDSWYINVTHSNCHYKALLGIRYSDDFFPLIESNTVFIPSEGPSSSETVHFANCTEISPSSKSPDSLRCFGKVKPEKYINTNSSMTFIDPNGG